MRASLSKVFVLGILAFFLGLSATYAQDQQQAEETPKEKAGSGKVSLYVGQAGDIPIQGFFSEFRISDRVYLTVDQISGSFAEKGSQYVRAEEEHLPFQSEYTWSALYYGVKRYVGVFYLQLGFADGILDVRAGEYTEVLGPAYGRYAISTASIKSSGPYAGVGVSTSIRGVALGIDLRQGKYPYSSRKYIRTRDRSAAAPIPMKADRFQSSLGVNIGYAW